MEKAKGTIVNKEVLQREMSQIASALLQGLEAGFKRAGITPEDLEVIVQKLEEEQRHRRSQMEAEHEKFAQSLRKRFGRP